LRKDESIIDGREHDKSEFSYTFENHPNKYFITTHCFNSPFSAIF
jgi:hypothetical protein